LADGHRSGRPRVFGAAVVIELKALACELVTREVVAAISAATVWRTLRKDAIRPWYYRSWIAPRDPDFAVKAARVLDLYASCFEDQTLGDNEFVISADEKTSIQARCRCHPTLPPGRARLIRVEHEYEYVDGATTSGIVTATSVLVGFGRRMGR
jgi:hypothetical protein